MFSVIHDLSSISEEARKQYLRDYSVFLGLNPDENRIDMIWMNTDNVRALVAYCRRGTTDILRDIYSIDITGLVKEDGPGYVSFQASGINRRGRKEIAVGAYTTTGLTGDRLAAAVATAQTRALRRLTLQFVGGGLLDESEVSNTVVQAPSLLTLPAIQPETKPSGLAGRRGEGMTPGTVLIDHGPKPQPLSEPAVITNVSALPAEPVIVTPIAASLQAANAILAAASTETPSEAVKKARKPGRPRKSKNTVDMGDEPVKSADADIPQSQLSATPTGQQLTYVPTCPDCGTFMAADDRLDMYLCVKHGRVDTSMKPSVVRNSAAKPEPVVAPVPITPVEPPKIISPLTPDEQKQVKTRMAAFWVDILPKGGMTADDGLSIWGKLVKYADGYFQDAPNHKLWTIDRWEMFLERLDAFSAAHGATKLVEHINTAIGGK